MNAFMGAHECTGHSRTPANAVHASAPTRSSRATTQRRRDAGTWILTRQRHPPVSRGFSEAGGAPTLRGSSIPCSISYSTSPLSLTL